MLTARSLFPVLLTSMACSPTITQERYVLPKADLSASNIDFGEVDWGDSVTRNLVLTNNGELPMGIGSIALGEDGMEDNFALVYYESEIACDDSDDTGSSAGAKEAGLDSGGWEETGGWDSGDENTSEDDEDDTLVLDPGCELSIRVKFSPVLGGAIYGSVIVETTTQAEYDRFPDYYRDPDEFKRIVLLMGDGVDNYGKISVSPRSYDFGHVYTDETETAHIAVENEGEGDLTLGTLTLDDDCDAGFSVGSSYEAGQVVSPDTSTLFEIDFTPEDQDPASCTLYVASDDPSFPTTEVHVQGNEGRDPDNEAPTVEIRSPDPGYMHTSGDPLEIELNVFDANQPATSLVCKVKSAVLLGFSLASCTPEDESGHVIVEIDVDDLGIGLDTLLVTVTDASESSARDSTTILYRTDYPEGDDDGDGFDEADEDYADCDDSNSDVYPEAAEVYDGVDNDCDGLVDENTEGSDDDGDTITELEGDCDDTNADTYPSAPEDDDGEDNDCDGLVDEGTQKYDDDGDGFTEVENDCDDDDETINPSATEYCDSIDNDCDGWYDELDDCISLDSEPMIIGGIQMDHNAVGPGETTSLTVFAYDSDGQEITYAWQEDSDLTSDGHTALDNASAQSVNWTAPEDLPPGEDAIAYSVVVMVQDEDGNQDWAFDEIVVYDDPVDTVHTRNIEEPICGGSQAAILPLLPLLGVLVTRRRRREDEADTDVTP